MVRREYLKIFFVAEVQLGLEGILGLNLGLKVSRFIGGFLWNLGQKSIL
jgi:hypothetical protein